MKTESQCWAGAAAWSLENIRRPAAGVSDMGTDREAPFSQEIFWARLAPCQNKLYNFIRKSLAFSPDADDVFQETVLNAFRYIRSYREGGEFGAWLFGIAHNEIKKHYKKRPKIAAPLELERLGAADTSPVRQMIDEVYRFAERLDPRQREVFFLFYDEGFSMAEIAGITGLGQGHIKFILHQARNALKTILGVFHDE